MADLVPQGETRSMLTLRDAIDRLFRESFVRPWGESSLAGGQDMSLDVYDEDDHVTVEATMPGVKPDDIEISVRDNVLVIKAETKQEKDVSEDRYSYRERSYGMMQRSVALPSGVDADKAEAKLEDGVLKLTLPKSERERPHRIQVKAGEQASESVS